MTDDASALLARITAEEEELVFPAFGLDDAWALGTRMRDAAAAAGHPVAIGITLGLQRVFHAALPGSTPDNDVWLERKARVVRHYSRSSFGVGAQFRASGKEFETASRLDIATHAAHGGVFPITVAGTGVVGTAGISGLPQVEDHDFVVEHLRAYLATRSA